MSGTEATAMPAATFAIHGSASSFAVTRQAYTNSHAHAGYGLIGTGALVFDTTDPSMPRILLIQRASTDSMPNKWEVPGGACDDEDETILHGVARELWEEAGLKATFIREAVGNPHIFVSRSGKPICKLNFVVDVERDADGGLNPRLDPSEHQQYVWASKAEVMCKKVGDIELDFTSGEMETLVIRTFEEMARDRGKEDMQGVQQKSSK